MRCLCTMLGVTALQAFAPAATAETIAIVNAHIYTMGVLGELSAGGVLIRDGKVVAVGPSITIPAEAHRIDAGGRIVTPGFMMAGTTITIVDLPSYGILDDSATASPEVSAGYDVQYSINPEAPEIADARADGVTRALVTPDVGHRVKTALIFGGQAAMIRLSDSRDLLTRPAVGVTMEGGASGAGLVGGGRGAEIVLLRAILADVRRFAIDPHIRDEGVLDRTSLSAIDRQALVPVVKGEIPLIVQVDRASDISILLKVAKEEKIRLVLWGAAEGWVVAKDIAAAGVPVIVDPEINIPDSLNRLGATYENAARLQAAGVTIAFEAVHARPGDLVRSPRVTVGRLVGQGGLPFVAALAGLTTGPAMIGGLASQLGSIEPGKIADVVVWSGDPLEATTYPQTVIIDGVVQPLRTRQDLLGRRYLDQYRAQGLLPKPLS